MVHDQIRYDILVQEALRNVIRKVLTEVAKAGLPGDHHFFITFLTNGAGVKVSQRLKDRYPEQMTIVLQHQFWDLIVSESQFEVSLSFGDVPEKLVIPFSAVQVFYDPAAAFEAAFDLPSQPPISDNDSELESETQKILTGPKKPKRQVRKIEKMPKSSSKMDDSNNNDRNRAVADVVSLDAFRKNKD